MAQSLAWGADLLLSPRIALGVSLAISLQVTSASVEGAWVPLPAPREMGQGGRWAVPVPVGQPGALLALGVPYRPRQAAEWRVSLGLVICRLEMGEKPLVAVCCGCIKACPVAF